MARRALLALFVAVIVTTATHGIPVLLPSPSPAPASAVFPYREYCWDANGVEPSSANPWRARLAYQEDRNGATIVTMKIWAEDVAPEEQIDLNRIMIQLPDTYTLERYRDSFSDAYIVFNNNTYNASYTEFIWSDTRPVVRFAGLNFHYRYGQRTVEPGWPNGHPNDAYTMVFKMSVGSMNEMCQGDCAYAALTNETCTQGTLGRVPVIVVEGPDFVVAQPPGAPVLEYTYEIP